MRTLKAGPDGKKRCFGNLPGQQFYADYHDHEWGVPVHDDHKLFEMLALQGTQAGLSWPLILSRRAGYRQAFYQFDPQKVALMTDEELSSLMKERSLIRNRLKIWAVRTNARVFLNIQEEFGSFKAYVWQFAPPSSCVRETLEAVPCFSLESGRLSKDLKTRGMTFVGPKIIYSFMQAVGLINDHVKGCCFELLC